MTEHRKTAIVILNWNGEALLDTFLPSVVRNSSVPGVEVYVADNGSSDRSVEWVREHFPQVKTIELKKNVGFAEGYNRALKEVEAEYFVLLNSDVEVTPGWLDPCIRLMEEDRDTAAVQPKILSYRKPHQFEYAGAAGGFIDKYGYPFCRGRILNRTEPDLGQYNKVTTIFWASGACMFIRADLFKEAGGFDPDFWAHMEEIDLSWRLKNKGYKIVYQPDSVVFHLGGGTLSYNSPQKVYLNFRNNLFMLFKNLSPDLFYRILLTRLLLDGVAAIKFLAGFYFSSFRAVVKAHVVFYKNLGELIRKRKKLQHENRIKKHAEIYPGSIMWKFFIRKIKRFTDLNFYWSDATETHF